MKILEGPTEIGVGVDVYDVSVDGLVDGRLDVVVCCPDAIAEKKAMRKWTILSYR